MKRMTFCLNADKASDETYLTWTTIEFRGDTHSEQSSGSMFRLTNAEGNGQVYAPCGAWSYVDGFMFVSFDHDTIPNRIAAHCLLKRGAIVTGARGYGAAYPLASWEDVTHSRRTMPLKARNRDKNETNRSVERITGKPACYAGTDETILARNQAAIMAQRAMDRLDRAAARREGITVATYRALKGK